jgi:hypothetical protein
MSKPLQSASIAAPGFFGLNTQESSVTLQDGFALVADNCVIDRFGRLGARKGYRYLTSGSTGVNLIGLHRFVDITGSETIISWSATSFFTGVGTLTQITPTTDNTITTGNWQCATLNDKAYFFQRGYKPMVYDPVAGTITDVEDEHNVTGTPPSGNTVLSAYGRLFVADTATDKMTVFFSDLLNAQHWNSGSAGSINLESILVKGTDEIVGLGAQNGQLIVFCKQNIVIFGDTGGSSTFDVANLRLVEVISRVGCVARDSIQNTGLDIFFLSEDGLRSLGRVIQEKSLPMRDLSANVRDDLVDDTIAENVNDIKSVYSEDNAFYLLLFPSFQRIYCFDTRAPLQNGALRVTLWDTQTQKNMLALPNAVYFAQTNGIVDYATFQDNGTAYRMKYFTTYFDFGSASQFKILKRLATTVIGGSGQDFVLKAGFDYTDSYQSFPAQLATKAVDEYGISEYNIAEYETGTLVEVVRSATGGTGNVLQIGFESNVNGAELSLQKLDIFVKQGRVF